MASRQAESWYREQAREQYHDEGVIEVDLEAEVSLNEDGDHGAYVQAWVWVADPDADERDEQEPDEAYERAAARARSNDFEETGGKDWT